MTALVWVIAGLAVVVLAMVVWVSRLQRWSGVYRDVIEAHTRALAALDSELAKTPFVAGNDATIGDVAVYGDVWYAHEAEIAVPANVQAWMKRVEALPGYKAPYDLLPKEDRG